jgi:hypothetical protein
MILCIMSGVLLSRVRPPHVPPARPPVELTALSACSVCMPACLSPPPLPARTPPPQARARAAGPQALAKFEERMQKQMQKREMRKRTVKM